MDSRIVIVVFITMATFATRQVAAKNRTVTVTTILSPPFVMESEDGSKFEGFVIDLLNAVSERASLKPVIHIVKDGMYGSLDVNTGLWKGMIGELVRKEADIAAADMQISTTREKVVDFTKPFLSVGPQILIGKPDLHKNTLSDWTFLISPFEWTVWVLVDVFALFVGAFLCLINRFSPYEWGQVSPERDERHARHSFNLRNSYLFVFSTYTWQGYREAPKSLSGRILAFFWWCFVLMFLIAYTAGLTAFIIHRPTSTVWVPPVSNVEELASQTEIDYGVLKPSSTYEFFKNSNLAPYQRMYSQMSNRQSFFSSTSDAVEKVRNAKGKMAAIFDSWQIKYLTYRNPCDLMTVGPPLYSSGFGFALPINSDLRQPLSIALLELRENGFIAGLVTKWWEDRRECPPDYSSGSRAEAKQVLQMSLTDMAYPFILMVVGAAISAACLILEIVYKRVCQQGKS